MANRNAYFQLYIKEGAGVALIIYPPEEKGETLNFEEIDWYFKSQGIEYPKLTVAEALKHQDKRHEILISRGNHAAINASARVVVNEEGTKVTARFYPPSVGLTGNKYTKREIISELEMKGVKFGINEEAIENFLEKPVYCTDIVIAKAQLPVEGKSASIEYFFNTDLSRKPKVNEDGSVDFHSLDNISPVGRGALLARLTPEVKGIPGTDVYGRAMQPLSVVSKTLKFGKNITISESRLEIYSDVNGHASLVDEQVFVTDNYEVPEDVDTSTGDIRYSGNIFIKGNVRTGYKVVCDGDIIVEGVVEGAYLEAKGQIILKRGIQGMGKGVLKAGSNIVSKFIERAEVYADGYVQSDAILHSKVIAGNEVIVSGKKGFISGGEIVSTRMISAKIAGSEMGTTTVLEVGIDPSIVTELKVMEKEFPLLMQESEKLEQLLQVFAKKLKSTDGVSQDKDKLLQMKNAMVTKKEIDQKIEEYTKRMDELSEKVENSTGGCIKVQDKMYPGCKVVISGAVFFARSVIQHSRLVKEGEDVRVQAY